MEITWSILSIIRRYQNRVDEILATLMAAPNIVICFYWELYRWTTRGVLGYLKRLYISEMISLSIGLQDLVARLISLLRCSYGNRSFIISFTRSRVKSAGAISIQLYFVLN